jgi:tetratricopeptide (TPR) repeat protein
LVTDGVRANIEGAGAGAQARVVLNMASTDELFESVEVGKPAKSMELEIEEQDIEGASDEQGVRALGQTEATTVIAKKNKEVSPGKAGAKNETNEKVTSPKPSDVDNSAFEAQEVSRSQSGSSELTLPDASDTTGKSIEQDEATSRPDTRGSVNTIHSDFINFPGSGDSRPVTRGSINTIDSDFDSANDFGADSRPGTRGSVNTIDSEIDNYGGGSRPGTRGSINTVDSELYSEIEKYALESRPGTRGSINTIDGSELEYRLNAMDSERSYDLSSMGGDYYGGDEQEQNGQTSPDKHDGNGPRGPPRAFSAPRYRTNKSVPTIFEEGAPVGTPMANAIGPQQRPQTAPGKAPIFPMHEDYESENDQNSSIAYTRHSRRDEEDEFDDFSRPTSAELDEEEILRRGLMKGKREETDGAREDDPEGFLGANPEPLDEDDENDQGGGTGSKSGNDDYFGGGDEGMHHSQVLQGNDPGDFEEDDDDEFYRAHMLDENIGEKNDGEEELWERMEDPVGTPFFLNRATGEQRRMYNKPRGDPSGIDQQHWKQSDSGGHPTASPLRRPGDNALYSRRTPKRNTLKRGNQSAEKMIKNLSSIQDSLTGSGSAGSLPRSAPSPNYRRRTQQIASPSRGGILSASSSQYLPIRVVVHRANARGEINDHDRGGGQMVDVPYHKYKKGKVSVVARKEAFEEFVYDVAIRLQMARNRDPIAVPSSPSRRHRKGRLEEDIDKLKKQEQAGQYVDPIYVGQLENKLRLMEEAEKASAGSIISSLAKDSQSSGKRDRGHILEPDELMTPWTPRDRDRFTLWHATYRAQILDFDSIRNGDMLLVRDSDDKPESSGVIAGGSMLASTTSLASLKSGGDGHAMNILRPEKSAKRMGPGMKHKSKEETVSDISELEEPSKVEESEDKLRMRRLGLSQLLNAIRSKRSLFGVPLIGAKAAFKAMDRRGKGVISVDDFAAGMHRLDIKLPKAALNELARMVGNGEDVRYPEFLTALRMAAGDELAFAEEAPSEYGGSDEEIPDSMNVNEIPARLVKRQRRKRKSYKSLPVDQRPDEALVWDIEAAPDNPEPLQKYAERLIVRKQYERAIDYLERALAAAQRAASHAERHLNLKWTSKHKTQLAIMLRLATLNAMAEQFDGAEQLMQESIVFAVGHNRAEPLAAYAVLMERLRQFDKAEEAYLRALALDAECTAALLGYANLLVDIHADHTSAEKYYERALRSARLDVHDKDVPLVVAKRCVTEAYLNYAVFLSTLRGDHVKALELLEKASKVQPEKNAPILVELGRIHAAAGDMITEHIVEHYEAALRIEPDYPDAMLELAMILSSRSKDPRDQRRALEFFEKVLMRDPNNGATLLAMARHLDFSNGGAPLQIEQLYRRAITAIDGEARLARGRPAIQPWEPRLSLATYLEFKREDIQRAGSLYEEACRLAPFEPEVLLALGMFRKVVHEDIDGAEAVFHKALDADPLHGGVLVAMGDLLWMCRGEGDAAEVMYKRAANVAGKKDATALRSYALFQASRNNEKAAASLFRKAIKADPDHAPSHAAYGLILMYKLKDYELAERELLRAIEMDPSENVEALHHLGRLYEEQVLETKGITNDGGQAGRERALRCYRNALAVDAEHVPTLIRMGLLLKTVANMAHPADARATLDRAEESLARAAASAPEDADPNYEYGAFLLDRGVHRLGAARRHLRRAIALDPCHVLALDCLAESYVREKDPDYHKAEIAWVEALDIDPGNAPSMGDYVQFLENIRSRCVSAEARVVREDDPEAARALVLYQQLRRYATLKAIYASRTEELGDSTWLRHNRTYLKAFRKQFEKRK